MVKLLGFPPRGPFGFPDYSRSANILDVFHHNIKAEATAIRDYDYAADLALRKGDMTSFRLFTHIKEEEEHHHSELKQRVKDYMRGK